MKKELDYLAEDETLDPQDWSPMPESAPGGAKPAYVTGKHL